MRFQQTIKWVALAMFLMTVGTVSVRAEQTSTDHAAYSCDVDSTLFQLSGDPATEMFGGWLSHDADTLVLSCMDFRLIANVTEYMDKVGKKGSYDYVVLAGASLGVNNTAFPDWGKTFWDHLTLSRDLHSIRNVMIIDHRNCGAYKAILKEDYPEKESKDQQQQETASHKKQLDTLAQAIHEKYPFLGVQTRLMSLDGTVEDIADLHGTAAMPEQAHGKH